MQTTMRHVLVLLLAIWTAGAMQAQIATAPITSNPIPAPIVKRGLAVEIRDLVRLPDTRGVRPLDQDVSPAGWARPPPLFTPADWPQASSLTEDLATLMAGMGGKLPLASAAKAVRLASLECESYQHATNVERPAARMRP